MARRKKGSDKTSLQTAPVECGTFSPPAGSRLKSIAISFTLILLASLVAFSPVFSAGFIWDDDDYITQNIQLRDSAGLARIWLQPSATPQYYPLVHTTFWCEYQLWGLNPLGYHIVNLLVHVASACVLFLVLRRLTISGALLAALLFAVHPVQVESVAWVTERKNTLSTLFYLLSFLFFLISVERRTVQQSRARFDRRFALSMLLFIGGLLSKTVVCTLPLALGITLWWRWGRIAWIDLVRLVGMCLVGVSFAWMTVTLERDQVGAVGDEFDWTWAERILIAGRAICFYMGKIFLPIQQAFFYPRWELDSNSIMQWLFPLAVIILLSATWFLRSRIGRHAFAALSLYLVALLPALGFVNVYPFRYSFVADHFQYLASIYPLVFVSALSHHFWCKLFPPLEEPNSTQRLISWGTVACLPLIGVLIVMTANYAKTFSDLETLWQSTLKRNPSAFAAHTNLAILYLQRNDREKGLQHLQESLKIKPQNNPEAEVNFLQVTGELKIMKGEIKPAQANFERVLNEFPSSKVASRAHYFLGLLAMDAGDFTNSEKHFRQSLQIESNAPGTMVRLADSLVGLGRNSEARSLFREIIDKWPERTDAQQKLRQLDFPPIAP
jgi:protein O-mannosyl-transferase